jgi:hypothetical protein
MDNSPNKMEQTPLQQARVHLQLALNDYFAIAKSAGQSREATVKSIKDMLDNDIAF